MLVLLPLLAGCSIGKNTAPQYAPIYIEGVVVEDGTSVGIPGIEVLFRGEGGPFTADAAGLTEDDGTFSLESAHMWIENNPEDADFDCGPCELEFVDIDGDVGGSWSSLVVPITLGKLGSDYLSSEIVVEMTADGE